MGDSRSRGDLVRGDRLFALLLVSLLAASCSGGDETTAQLTPQDRETILASVKEIRKAILQKDAKLLLQFVSKADGLNCTDTTYSYKEVAAFLANRDSHLYMSLFDNGRYGKQCGIDYPAEYPAIAEAEFLRSANEDVVLIRLSNDWAEAVIRSPVKSHSPREWYSSLSTVMEDQRQQFHHRQLFMRVASAARMECNAIRGKLC